MSFCPNFDKKLFAKLFLSFREKEGCRPIIFRTLNEELSKISGPDSYDKIIQICNAYNVKFISAISNNLYEVIILTSGHESFKYTYSEKEKDITEELEKIMFNQLATQIINKDFLDDVINQTEEINNK